jgi:hypothetical protein
MPARTRHEKGGPFKHEGSPSKHDENRLESPLIWLAQMAHESHLCISSQTLIPYPPRSAAAASISPVRRFLLCPPPSSRPWVAAATVVGCSREAAAAPWAVTGRPPHRCGARLGDGHAPPPWGAVRRWASAAVLGARPQVRQAPPPPAVRRPRVSPANIFVSL